MRTAARLSRFNHDFFSVTYGAGGSTKTRTYQVVRDLNELGYTTIPHLSWGDVSKQEVIDQISSYNRVGVNGMVVLRGDTPSGSVGEVTHHANELVQLIRNEFGQQLQLFVAAYPERHPEAQSWQDDLQHLKAKVAAGADACITQYFYNIEAYLNFVEECQKVEINVPIIPGVMPLYNYSQLIRFSKNCGADIPRWIERRMSDYQDNREALEDFGIEVLSHLCHRLQEEGAPGFHFYTLNRALTIQKILRNLDLDDSAD